MGARRVLVLVIKRTSIDRARWDTTRRGPAAVRRRRRWLPRWRARICGRRGEHHSKRRRHASTTGSRLLRRRWGLRSLMTLRGANRRSRSETVIMRHMRCVWCARGGEVIRILALHTGSHGRSHGIGGGLLRRDDSRPTRSWRCSGSGSTTPSTRRCPRRRRRDGVAR